MLPVQPPPSLALALLTDIHSRSLVFHWNQSATWGQGLLFILHLQLPGEVSEILTGIQTLAELKGQVANPLSTVYFHNKGNQIYLKWVITVEYVIKNNVVNPLWTRHLLADACSLRSTMHETRRDDRSTASVSWVIRITCASHCHSCEHCIIISYLDLLKSFTMPPYTVRV